MSDAPDQTESPSDPGAVAQTTAQLRVAHHQEAGELQHAVDRLTAIVGWPGFVVLLALAIIAWVAVNLGLTWSGHKAPDPPPFAWLQTFTSAGALVLSALIVTTQRREDKLADHRAQLILELSVANDQKVAKIIGLLEEHRRDNPALIDRNDPEATAMANPSDPGAVLEAIKELSDNTVLPIIGE